MTAPAAIQTPVRPRPGEPSAVAVDGVAASAQPLPVGPLLPVVGADLRVPLVQGGQERYANLDYAASAPCLSAVAARVEEILPFYASVHRGAGYASQVTTALYESARGTVGAFVGARPTDVVVFTRNTTDALNLLARCLPGTAAGGHPDDSPGRGADAGRSDGDGRAGDAGPGDVLFLDVEHHANLLPWRAVRHRCLPAAGTVGATLDRLRRALAHRPACLVAVTGASNVTGEVVPVAEIARIAHAHGARIVVDAAQLAPHRRVDMAAWDVDYVALSAHKLYAPYGAGALIGRADWLDAAPPYLAGGGAVAGVTGTTATWKAAPERHEAGSPNSLGAAALAAACQVLAALAPGALERHEAALRDHLVAGLSGLPGVEIPRIWADASDRLGVVTFTVPGDSAARAAAYLSAEHGIGVRDGRFCAHPLLARLGLPGSALRASVGVGTRSDDIDRLVTALRTYLRDGPGWTYQAGPAGCAPVPDTRPLPGWFAPDAATPPVLPALAGICAN
ncbi:MULTISPECIES: aminotransferase class V-fold PLP-dependent enzyme [unclassified Frankia]|uniref:aminotransferase class V-fold PLP-dependent enzyme n=1 Tax=unclassified Frankia TaxID=2632575 RepID=UPI002024E6A1